MKRWMAIGAAARTARVGLLLVAAVVVPACGGGAGDYDYTLPSYTPPPPPPPVVLMEDFFTDLSKWTVVSPSAFIDHGTGNPPPCLQLHASGGVAARVRSKLQFSTSLGLVVVVDAFPGTSNGAVVVVDSAKPGVLDTFASFTATGALLSIKGTTKSVTFPSDGKFHLWEFAVTSGVAAWALDGVTLFIAPFSASNVYLELFDQGAGTGTWINGVMVMLP